MADINTTTPQLKAVKRWIDAYASLDIQKIDSLFSRNFKHQTLPKSLGRDEETREDYIVRLGRVLPMFTSFRPTVHDVTEVPGKVIAHVTDICSTVHGVTLTYETIYTLTFVEEDGELKFSRIQEFIDTQEYVTFFAKIAEVMAEKPPTYES